MNIFLNTVGETAIGKLPDGARIAIRRSLRMARDSRRLARAHVSVIGHPKTGSTWMRIMLSRLYQRKFALPESVIPAVEECHRLDRRAPLIYMAGYEHIKQVIDRATLDRRILEQKPIFIARHPCDLVVSLYFHILKHATRERKLFNRWPLDLEDRSLFDFAMSSDWGLSESIWFLNNCARYIEHMKDRCLLVRYEDMRLEPHETLGRIVSFIGTRCSSDEIDDVVAYGSFDNLRKMEQANTLNSYRLRPGNVDDPDSYKVRRGKVFGYRDYFSDGECRTLEDMVSDKLSPIFGYAG